MEMEMPEGVLACGNNGAGELPHLRFLAVHKDFTGTSELGHP